MKRLHFLLIIALPFVLLTHSYAQADSTIYKVKIDQYQRWQRAGSITIISGAVVEAAGIGLLIAGNIAANNGNSDDEYIYPGYVAMGIGVATMVTGFIFRGIGKRKVVEYNIKLNDVRTGFYYTPRHSGIVLTYSF